MHNSPHKNRRTRLVKGRPLTRHAHTPPRQHAQSCPRHAPDAWHVRQLGCGLSVSAKPARRRSHTQHIKHPRARSPPSSSSCVIIACIALCGGWQAGVGRIGHAWADDKHERARTHRETKHRCPQKSKRLCSPAACIYPRHNVVERSSASARPRCRRGHTSRVVSHASTTHVPNARQLLQAMQRRSGVALHRRSCTMPCAVTAQSASAVRHSVTQAQASTTAHLRSARQRVKRRLYAQCTRPSRRLRVLSVERVSWWHRLTRHAQSGNTQSINAATLQHLGIRTTSNGILSGTFTPF